MKNAVPLSLVADIGGTNARFGLLEKGALEPFQIKNYLCASFDTIVEAITTYLDSNLPKGREIDSACLGVASTVNTALISFTNNHWTFERSSLSRHLGIERLLVLNDFTAMALGMLQCPSNSMIDLLPGSGEPFSPIVVTGPGTGLGFSALIPKGSEPIESWIALSTLGGHVPFTPRSAIDIEVQNLLSIKFKGRVSIERVLSGQGLVDLYQSLCVIRQQPVWSEKPAEVVAQAVSGEDAVAVETLERFFEHLGAFCGDMTLAYGARGGVYLCGGILPRMVSALQASGFKQAFLDKGRFAEFVSDVPVKLCVDSHPGLKGAALALAGPNSFLT